MAERAKTHSRGNRGHIPKRGEIKAKIFSSLFKSLFAFVCKACGKEESPKEGNIGA